MAVTFTRESTDTYPGGLGGTLPPSDNPGTPPLSRQALLGNRGVDHHSRLARAGLLYRAEEGPRFPVPVVLAHRVENWALHAPRMGRLPCLSGVVKSHAEAGLVEGRKNRSEGRISLSR